MAETAAHAIAGLVTQALNIKAQRDLFRAALQRIANDDVDADLKGRADILSGIAWAALNIHQREGSR